MMEERKAELIKSLESTYKKLAKTVEGLTEDDASWRPMVDRWAVVEVIMHLADTENEAYGYRLSAMLRENGVKVLNFDEKKAARERDYLHKEIPRALNSFRSARANTVELIRATAVDQWSRKCVHETRGNLTFEGIVEDMVKHDENHLDQIQRIKDALAGKPYVDKSSQAGAQAVKSAATPAQQGKKSLFSKIFGK